MPQRTFEAVIDEHGNARFPGAVRLPQGTKVTVLVEEAEDTQTEFNLPELKPGAVYRMDSPRLVHAADAVRLQMDMEE
ncbi:MAG: hypothetical protein H7Y38_06410 [Armatimonadetes bacterium]|nr:hypothetical protein [Armatimonadota bacterium]